MSSIVIGGDISGAATIAAPINAGTPTLTLPTTTGNIVADTAVQTLTNKSLTAPAFTGAVTSSGRITGEGNGLVPSELYYALYTPVVGANVTTAQSLFGLTNGLTVQANTTYEIEMMWVMTKSAGVSAHNIQIQWAGASNPSFAQYQWFQYNASSQPANGASNMGSSNVTTLTTLIPGSTTAGQFQQFLLKGIIGFNTGGYFLPQYVLTTAPGGAYTISQGSYIKLTPLGSSTANIAFGTVS